MLMLVRFMGMHGTQWGFMDKEHRLQSPAFPSRIAALQWSGGEIVMGVPGRKRDRRKPKRDRVVPEEPRRNRHGNKAHAFFKRAERRKERRMARAWR